MENLSMVIVVKEAVEKWMRSKNWKIEDAHIFKRIVTYYFFTIIDVTHFKINKLTVIKFKKKRNRKFRTTNIVTG